MKNGLNLVHRDRGIPVEIPLNYKEMQLAIIAILANLSEESISVQKWRAILPVGTSDRINYSWNLMCELVLDRTGEEFITKMAVVSLLVEGNEIPLHNGHNSYFHKH
jgi:hypothetical protein